MRLRARFLCLLLLAGCGLVPPEPVDFRQYPLVDVSLDEAASVVYDVTRRFALDHWGGIGIVWDPVTRNIALDPVHQGMNRLTLRIHLEPRGKDIVVEMLALVQTLESNTGKVSWAGAKQDVPLEDQLYQAYVAELVVRKGPR